MEFRERLRLWNRLARVMPEAERLSATTQDGQRLALFRVRPRGASRGAVLLLHGLGANRFAFHWPGRSVAEFLAAQGFDAYVGELRGAGESAPHLPTWNFHEYLEQDVPALLERVREVSRLRRVHFIGHSMGGILAMCQAIVSKGEGLASVAAMGSAFDYGLGESGFGPLERVRPVLARLRLLPWGVVMGVIAPVLARLNDPLAGFNFHPGNAEAALVRAVYANVFGPIPTALLVSLSTALEPGGLKSRAGESYQALATGMSTRLLMIAASDDRQCPLPAFEATAAASRATAMRFGSRYGHQVDYGHFDLVLGRTAPDEVWPALLSWLEASA